MAGEPQAHCQLWPALEKISLPVELSKGINNYNPATNLVTQCGTGGTPQDCGMSLSNLLFAPSIGIAYRLTDSFVLRAGFSLSPQQNNAVAQSGVFSFPDQLNATFTGPNSYTPGAPSPTAFRF